MNHLDYMLNLYKEELFKNIGSVTSKSGKEIMQEHMNNCISFLEKNIEKLEKWYPNEESV